MIKLSKETFRPSNDSTLSSSTF